MGGPENHESDQIQSKGGVTVESMRDPGYHIGKIDLRSLNDMDKFGLNMKNTRIEGLGGVVILNSDKKFNLSRSINGGEPKFIPGGVIALDNGTKSIETYGLKQDGFNNPNAPLRIRIENKDGSIEDLVFSKIRVNEEPKEVDTFLESYKGNPQDLINLPRFKPQFDAIVKNWMNISNDSVTRFKELVREYTKSYGKELQANFTLQSGINQEGHPCFFINGDPKMPIYNSGGKSNSDTPRIRKPDINGTAFSENKEKGVTIGDIKLIDGRNIQLGYTSEPPYNYKYIVVEGERYDVIPGSKQRFRDGTTKSSYNINGNVHELHEPSPFKSREATLTRVK